MADTGSSSFSFSGRWEGKTAGGCANFPTMGHNPQWLITAPQAANLTITLSQTKVDSATLFPMGWVLADKGGERIEALYKGETVGSSGTYTNAASVDATVAVDGREVPYTLLASTFDPDCIADYTLSVAADVPVTVVQLFEEDLATTHPHSTTVTGAWVRDKTAGGSVNFPTTRMNPNYFLELSEDGPADVICVLTQTGETRHNISVIVADKKGERIEALYKGEKVADSGPYAPEEHVRARETLEPHDYPYTISCSTYNPDEEGEFELTVMCDKAFVLTAAPSDDVVELPHRTEISSEWVGRRAGGCTNFSTHTQNPMFHVLVADDTTVRVRLTQIPAGDDFFQIGCSIAETYTGIVGGERIGHSGKYINLESCAFTCLLPALSHPYLLFASTFNPEEECAFKITIDSSAPVSLTRADAIAEVAAPASSYPKVLPWPGKWDRHNSGGPLGSETAVENPQFVLEPVAATEIELTLTQTIPGVNHEIGFVVFDNGGDRVGDDDPTARVAEAPYEAASAVRTVFEGEAGKKYLVFVSTANAGDEGAFTLQIASNEVVLCHELDDEVKQHQLLASLKDHEN